MSLDRWERCDAIVGKGSHLCANCADALDRDAHAPFWGDFANHPDSLLRRFAADMTGAARDMGRDFASAARDLAADIRSAGSV